MDMQDFKLGNAIALIWVLGLMVLGLLDWYFAIPIMIYLIDFKLSGK